MNKGFLVLFFKKEQLPSFLLAAPLANRYTPGWLSPRGSGACA
jgi:hypothetical protein